jgi:hypothetical protein
MDKSELRFSEICGSKNYQINHATRDQDIYEHWDWQITNPKTQKVSLVDVKGARKKSRSDPKLDYNITWLELKNVRGKDGSLLGKADYIAFEQKDYFLIVRRDDLLTWVKSKITQEEFVEYSRDAKYRYYQRYGRQDVITMVAISDMKKDLKYWKFS